MQETDLLYKAQEVPTRFSKPPCDCSTVFLRVLGSGLWRFLPFPGISTLFTQISMNVTPPAGPTCQLYKPGGLHYYISPLGMVSLSYGFVLILRVLNERLRRREYLD